MSNPYFELVFYLSLVLHFLVKKMPSLYSIGRRGEGSAFLRLIEVLSHVSFSVVFKRFCSSLLKLLHGKIRCANGS